MSIIQVGPRRFSGTDARRSSKMAGALWATLVAGRDSGVVEELGRGLAGRLEFAAGLTAAQVDSVSELEVAERLAAAGSRLADTDAARRPEVIADVTDTFLAAAAALRAAGQLPARAEGWVDALHLGTGGVPKHPVERVSVGFGGVTGDRQASRVHHGHPIQALCLWSSEVIASLAADGHPIFPGAAGENVTLGGLHWPDVRPGVRLQVGTVTCEISAFAVPCSQNAQWFSDRDFRRLHHDRGNLSRVYAIVLVPGSIAVGDSAVLEP